MATLHQGVFPIVHVIEMLLICYHLSKRRRLYSLCHILSLISIGWVSTTCLSCSFMDVCNNLVLVCFLHLIRFILRIWKIYNSLPWDSCLAKPNLLSINFVLFTMMRFKVRSLLILTHTSSFRSQGLLHNIDFTTSILISNKINLVNWRVTARV